MTDYDEQTMMYNDMGAEDDLDLGRDDRCDDCNRPNAAADLTAMQVPNEDGGTDEVKVCLRCELKIQKQIDAKAVEVVKARREAVLA